MDRFCGRNDDSGATIADCESQDNLNVETNLTGTALKKRRGFTREAALTVTTAPVSGWAQHKCDNGDTLQVVCHSNLCAKSTNGGAFATFLTTATAGPVRWSFVSIDGDLYGANDKRDPVFVYNCTAITHPAEIPAGSILTLTEDRLVVGDTSANPNRVNYSKSGDFDEFTAGSATEDPFADDLGAPGERTTGLAYNAGILWRFTPQSITACETGDQYTQRCSIFSPNIGTSDPASIVIANGSIYFKGSDNSEWKIDQNGTLESISKKIKTFNRNLVSGAARNNTQTTQSDWENGSDTPDGSWNTASVAGSVFPSSVTFIDTSSVHFGSGTLTNTSTTSIVGALTMVQAGSGTFVNAGNEGSSEGINWETQTFADSGCGSGAAAYGSDAWCNCTWTGTENITFRVTDSSDNVITSQLVTVSQGIDQTVTLELSTFSHVMVKLYVTDVGSAFCGQTGGASARSAPFIRPERIAIRVKDTDDSGVTVAGWDIDENIARTTSGNIVSRAMDSDFTAPLWGPFGVDFSSSPQGAISFETQAATSASGAWDSLVAVSSGARIGSGQRQYIRYKASFSVDSTTNTPATLYSAQLSGAATGQIITQCIEPGSGASSFGIIACDFTTAGAGSVSIAIATSATCGGVSVYSAATNNATITNGIGAAMKIRLTSLLGSATDQAQVNACTTYWNDGTVAQPVFGVFDSIANAIYWTATTTAATQGDRVKKYDLNLEGSGVSPWFIFDLRATAVGFFQNSIYFGSSTGGFWNKYGADGINTDNGADINAYWKSRDFSGNDPFVEKDWKYISLIARNNVTSNFTTTYTDSFNKSSSYTVSLATSSAISYIRSTHSMAKRSPSNFLNVQVGNNSSTPFEVLGLRLDFAPQPWKAGSNP